MTSLTSTDVTAQSLSTTVRGLAEQLLSTEARTDLTFARLASALVLLPHGLQKTVGLFGGYGFSGTYGALTSSYGLPGVVAFLVIAIELVAPIALAFGLFSRLAAVSIGVIMVGAATFHFDNGFFMNWFGNQAGEGFQFHVLYLGALLPLIARGGGRYSLDARLARRLRG